MKTLHPVYARTILAALAAVSLFAVAAGAQTRYSGKITLPFQATWGLAILPAGTYQFSISSDSDGLRTTIHSADGKSSRQAFPVAMDRPHDLGGADVLLLSRGPNGIYVREARLGSAGILLAYSRPARRKPQQREQAETFRVNVDRSGE
jgi:hypothetical protein